MKEWQYKTCDSVEFCRNLQFFLSPLTLACVKQRLPQLKITRLNTDRRMKKNFRTPLPPLRDDGVKLAEAAATASGKFEIELRRLTDCQIPPNGAGDRKRQQTRWATIRLPWGGRQEATEDPSGGITRGGTVRASLRWRHMSRGSVLPLITSQERVHMSFSAGKSDTSINLAIISLIKTFVSNSFSHVLILINYF